MERLDERCKRICGITREDCFIKNRKQLSCIADMVINKASGIWAFIESAAEESRNSKAAPFLDEALKNIQELVNWVKFLQISHDLQPLRSLICDTRGSESRGETRYPLPEIYHQYIVMKINISGSFVPVVLSNFSRHGIQFKCREPLDIDSVKEGVLFTSQGIGDEVTFKVRMRYCRKHDDEYTAGGRIEEITGSTILDFFKNVYDLILNAVSEPDAGPPGPP